MNRGQISNLLRRLGLMLLTDRVIFQIQRVKNRRINKLFRLNNPEVKLPPDYLIYESFQINYQKYYSDSIQTAGWLADLLSKHIDLNNIKILDWGCGPGRIIRHLPDIIGKHSDFYGTDYNKESIEWCTENLTGIKFNHNNLTAILPYSSDSIDVIYGISVFTHLSEKLHYDWYNELYRILKPNGVMLFTTQGDNFKAKLTYSELRNYNYGQLIIRGNVKEGHRTFSAFHPQKFMRKLFSNAEILEHIESKPEKGKKLPQDIWIIKKKITID